MQQEELGYGTYGWRRIRRYACRMENIKAEATRRLAILKFWDKHGIAATLDAYQVSRRSVYR